MHAAAGLWPVQKYNAFCAKVCVYIYIYTYVYTHLLISAFVCFALASFDHQRNQSFLLLDPRLDEPAEGGVWGRADLKAVPCSGKPLDWFGLEFGFGILDLEPPGSCREGITQLQHFGLGFD